MSLQLKMKLQSATCTTESGQIDYRLEAVSGPENEPWSKFTPTGSLLFSVTNPACAELEAGDYLVTLTKVEP